MHPLNNARRKKMSERFLNEVMVGVELGEVDVIFSEMIGSHSDDFVMKIRDKRIDRKLEIKVSREDAEKMSYLIELICFRKAGNKKCY